MNLLALKDDIQKGQVLNYQVRSKEEGLFFAPDTCFISTTRERYIQIHITSAAALHVEPCDGSIDVLGGGHVGANTQTKYGRQQLSCL